MIRRLVLIGACAALIFAGGCRDPYADLELEQRWAAALHEKYSRDLRCVRPRQAVYLRGLLAEFEGFVERNPYELSLCILRGEQVNAFAMPAGRIFVYEGLLRAVETESQLAFVLGHELAHVLLRHSFLREKRRRLGRRFLERLQKERLPTLPVFLFGAAGLLRYSRYQEKNADLKAFGLIVAAGYDPQGAVSFMKLLHARSFLSRGALRTLLSTHPAPQTRERYLRRRVQRLVSGAKVRELSADFRALKRIYPTGRPVGP